MTTTQTNTERFSDGGRRSSEIRTLVVFHLGETSGPSRSLERELGWLATGGRLDLVTPESDHLAPELSALAPVTSLDYGVLMWPRGPLGVFALLKGLARDAGAFRAQIRRVKPDLVVAVSAMLPALLLAARLERVPVLVYAGEMFDRSYRSGPQRAVRKSLLARFTTAFATAIIACSDTVADQFRGGKASITTIYPPIGDGFGDGDRRAYRHRHGIGADQPCVAAVGAITEGRGQAALIQTMALVRQEFPRIRCLIAGRPYPRPQDHAYRDGLDELVRELELADVVTFTGFEKTVADVYAAADVFVNPARFEEPFGRAAFEAAMAGRPVVTTRVGAIDEIFRDRESALIVPPDDPAASAEAICELLREPELAQELASNARDFGRRSLSPERSLDSFQRVVETVLEGARTA